MQITYSTTVSIAFEVELFEGTEGGMRNEQFGNSCATLEQAIELWRQAETTRPQEYWVITARPSVTLNGGKKS